MFSIFIFKEKGKMKNMFGQKKEKKEVKTLICCFLKNEKKRIKPYKKICETLI